ncbi:carboxynorspermidine dehydrogenase [Magnetococcus marinus MC-1]|uniref:Carboxynorspermidine dehydrogenase n=1 Tax=Magnetococcus marinus (strain ATCC BAA-1437 / JCM 17883 / MC-1) TaxID=156889 RepID=A0L6K6_MAGMM|nr:saccharopine dehydrogenase family protein [Magnetococcus marinus]ABK43599.1 carboxynorspermidine dehydrogenase [Magnetococcus marinus MC-1]
MSRIMIIGCGGVASVVVRKCASRPEVFSHITLASRTASRCQAITEKLPPNSAPVVVEQVDADNVPELVALIQRSKPVLVINVALPYQDLTIMEACLQTGTHYLDTANYEHPDAFGFEYKEQWAYHQRFADAGLMALLGCGFDPGVTNIFCAHAQKELLDTIRTVDIFDCNAGDHHQAFATNFNPEINIREITQPGRYWEKGTWKTIPPLSESKMIDFPGVGERRGYLIYHEEQESLVKNIEGLERIRFWMTFSEAYITHLRVLENVGMTRIDPVMYEGHPVVPLQFLKALLPDPGSLAENYQGKTSIGCHIHGTKDGQAKTVRIFNICDHAECYTEVGAQAVSYTTGVPAMIGADLMVSGLWKKAGVYNVEQFDPTPFMERLNQFGLPWAVEELSNDPF